MRSRTPDCGAQHKMAAPKTASGPRSVPWLSLCLLSYIFGLVESGMLCRYKKETCIMTLSLASVNLVPDGAIGPLCPGESATFVCNTTADLLWETSSAPGGNHRIFLASQSPATLGVFILSVNSVSVMSGMVSSTATTINGVRPSDDGVTLVCFENTDLTMSEQAVLRVEGKFCLS